MDPLTSALLASMASAAVSSGIGAFAGRGGDRETKLQRQRRKLVDELVGSLKGQGPFSDLYSMDENAFQKSFVEPAKQRFESQIAPQIQQSYIASGQQRGTGLDDTLTRAGVDLDQMLNQYYFQAQESAKNRQMQGINAILGGEKGAVPGMSGWEAAGQGAAGFFSSPAWTYLLQSGLNAYNQPNNPINQPNLLSQGAYAGRAGFVG